MTVPSCFLPVIDLKNRQVVHAVAGQRDKYQPLQSRWTPHASDPLQLTKVLEEKLGLREFYVADLDAIENEGSHQAIIEQLLAAGYAIWLDAGVQSVQEMNEWLQRGIQNLILASESLQSCHLLEHAFRRQQADQLIFSLDLYQGRLKAKPGVFRSNDPLDVVKEVIQLGCRRLLILDTAAVGTQSGPVTLELCEKVKLQYSQMKVCTGGGVRSMQDAERLLKAGVNRILIASIIHAFSEIFTIKQK